ncbi:MAG: hypothetical protein FJW69_09155 [Actinobacteria bacterium]|nr:hypothetical protein [Actinomycetota bacterium]
MKNRIITITTIIMIIAIGTFFVIKFDLLSKIENKIYLQKIKNEILAEANEKYTDKPELITEKFTDKDGNEIFVKMKRIVVNDENTGQEVLMYEDIAEPATVDIKSYKGKIESIAENKIFFTVDKEFKKSKFGAGSYSFEDVKDYQKIYDLENYNLDFDENDEYFVCDHLNLDFKNLESIRDLEKIIGKYVRLQDSKFRDYYTGKEYKVLSFFTE